MTDGGPRFVAAELISTDRLDLVPLATEHADEMAVVLGDRTLHEFIGGEPEPVERLRARYERWVAGSGRADETWLNWVVRLRSSGELAGTVQATVHLTAQPPYAELAWVIGVPWQRRGLAVEASAGLAGWLRGRGIGRLVAQVHPDHAASAAVARAIGLSPTDDVVDGETTWA